jgi:N-acetyltransferase
VSRWAVSGWRCRLGKNRQAETPAPQDRTWQATEIACPTTRMELQPHLIGDLIELRPLTPDDWDELFAVGSDPLIWEQHPARDRYKAEVFRKYFQGGLDSGGAFVAIDRATGKIIGSSRFCDYDAEKSEVEIGWTFLARSHWGGKYNGEMKQLMLDHAFKFVDRVVFLIGATNFRSQKAVEKIGGVLVGRKQATTPEGIVYENVVFEIRKASR